MVEVTAAMVKELREATNVGMMECKRALQECGGDREEAIKRLRESGMAIATKRASRTANQGQVAAGTDDAGANGAMIEVNCETDFVARNENFQAFVAELLEKAKSIDGSLADKAQEDLVAKIAEIGENMVIRRNVRFTLQGSGRIGSYVHLGGKVGVLVELACGRPDTAAAERFLEVLKDLTLHIAAANPAYLDREEVPADILDAERAIYAKQAEGKPAQIVDKIVDGKLNKYFAQVCLREQAFVKDTDLSVSKWLQQAGGELGDELNIVRFARYQLGESLD